MCDEIKDFDVLKEKASVFSEIEADDPFQLSYRYFVEYFEDCDVITEKEFFIATNFTYGWMPTILKYKSKKSKQDFEQDRAQCIEFLNIVKNGKRLDGEQLKVLKRTINNSIVGTSKLLHFINPDLYAIWDSRVCRFLHSTAYKTNTIKRFLEYIDCCDKVTELKDYAEIHQIFLDHVKYKDFEVSNFRSLEQLMFLNGRKKEKS